MIIAIIIYKNEEIVYFDWRPLVVMLFSQSSGHY